MLRIEGWTPAVFERLCPVTKLWRLLMNKKALVHRLPFPHSLKPQGRSSAADLVTLTGLSSATSLNGTLTRQNPQWLEGPCTIVEASVKALRAPGLEAEVACVFFEATAVELGEISDFRALHFMGGWSPTPHCLPGWVSRPQA